MTADRAQLLGIALVVGLVSLALLSLSGPRPRLAWLERLQRKSYGPRERLQLVLTLLGALTLIGLVLLAALLAN